MANKNKHPNARTRYDRLDVSITFKGPGLTKQSFKDECDVNNIVAKYQKTGAITHFAKHAPQYDFCTGHDLKESIEIVNQANEMFAELPSAVRKLCNNDPAEFLQFVQDPANAAQMSDLGLSSNTAALTPLMREDLASALSSALSASADPTPDPAPQDASQT